MGDGGEMMWHARFGQLNEMKTNATYTLSDQMFNIQNVLHCNVGKFHI